MDINKYLKYLNENKIAPVSSKQANIRQNIKASRKPDDKHGKLNHINNQINKIVHHIKT
jgi:hypothetical protein